jgi:hypothetical protein
MPNEIRNYQTAEGLDDVQMAALLSDRLGREIGVPGYRIIKGRRDAPVEWLEALSIAPVEPAGVADKARDVEVDAGPSAPTKPSASIVLPFEVKTAQKQIELMYVMAGKGAAMGLRSPPVAELWAASAPGIAAAYIEWAKESQTVANAIALITLGGPKGQLVLLHGELLVMTLILSGKVDPQQFVPPAMRVPTPPDAGTDGSGVAPGEGVPDGDLGEDEPLPAEPPKRTRKPRAKAATG